MEGGIGGVEAEGKEGNARIQTGGLAELMGTRLGAFLLGNNLHNGKVAGVGAESSPLVGTVSAVEGETFYQIEGQIPRCSEREIPLMYVCTYQKGVLAEEPFLQLFSCSLVLANDVLRI
ncbi:unnamed protein product [Pleuronectes platessa]|uniref:Uncharacterized protein n=1 Tax=Pleuronectes platessa TaxID=8262 RepID=A0A9N7UI54_PLEPL|nr:unnamed protein product [Pleuronectes platessa]